MKNIFSVEQRIAWMKKRVGREKCRWKIKSEP